MKQTFRGHVLEPIASVLGEYVAMVGIFEVRTCFRNFEYWAMLRVVDPVWGPDKVFAEPDDNYMVMRQSGKTVEEALENLEATALRLLTELEDLRLR